MPLVNNINIARRNKRCKFPQRYHADEMLATEQEIVDLVWGFVRALQPNCVLETGTYTARTSEAIQSAIRMNGQGRLFTIEIDEKWVKEAEARLDAKHVEVVHASSKEWTPPEGARFQFCWFDTEPKDELAKEFLRFRPWIDKGAIVGFHDTGTAFTTMPYILALEEMGLLKTIHIPCPRGANFCEVL